MAHIWVYGAAALFFLAIDAIWLKSVMSPMFEARVGALLVDELRLAPAAGFYVFYVAGILYFCTMPGLRADSLGLAMLNGAFLGLLAYGSYEATNFATLKGWTVGMVAVDVSWGAALTGSTAGVAWLLGRKFGLG